MFLLTLILLHCHLLPHSLIHSQPLIHLWRILSILSQKFFMFLLIPHFSSPSPSPLPHLHFFIHFHQLRMQILLIFSFLIKFYQLLIPLLLLHLNYQISLSLQSLFSILDRFLSLFPTSCCILLTDYLLILLSFFPH
jgi:hypothetical protein